MSEVDPISISRTIYDPAIKDFVTTSADAKALPHIKEWINQHNPVIYWYILRIDNPADVSIDQWAVELYTHQALTITEAYIEGSDRSFQLQKERHDPWTEKYILSVPLDKGIPIVGRGIRRIFFKVDIDCKEGLMHEYGISGTFMAQGVDSVDIKEKIFQYSCKVDEFKQIFDKDPYKASHYAEERLSGKYPSNSVHVFTNSFRMIHELSNYCHSGSLDKDELLQRLKLLYASFEDIPEIAGERISPLIHDGIRELDVIVDRDKLAPRYKRLCDSLVERLHMEVMGAEIKNETAYTSSSIVQDINIERTGTGIENARIICPSCGNIIDSSNKSLICRECGKRFCTTCEEWFRVERKPGQKPLCEDCFSVEQEQKKREEDERRQREEEELLQREKEEKQRIEQEAAERKKQEMERLRKKKEDEEKAKKQKEEQERRRREEDEKLRRQREEEKARKNIESQQREKVESERKEKEERQRREAEKREQKAKEDSEKIAHEAALRKGHDAAARSSRSPAIQHEVKKIKSSNKKFYVLALVLGALLVGYLLLSLSSVDFLGMSDVPITAISSPTPEMTATVTSIVKETPSAVIASSINDKTITNSIGMEFVLIPAGEFEMGSPSSEKYRNSMERPVHTVTIKKPYYLGKYEVTQAQWREVMGNNPSYFEGDDLPVEQVSWNDVQEFVKKLNEMEGTDKYRLPSEAEWEYAARAGTTTRYSFGNDESDLGEYAWYGGYGGNSNRKTHPVGQKKPNVWGLYDMYGNVREWVLDEWHENYDGAPTDGSSWESGSSAYRVYRNCCWSDDAWECWSAFSFYGAPWNRLRGQGFRLLQEL